MLCLFSMKNEMYFSPLFKTGQQILTLAVLSILITAPLGAVSILALGPKLLETDKVTIQLTGLIRIFCKLFEEYSCVIFYNLRSTGPMNYVLNHSFS